MQIEINAPESLDLNLTHVVDLGEATSVKNDGLSPGSHKSLWVSLANGDGSQSQPLRSYLILSSDSRRSMEKPAVFVSRRIGPPRFVLPGVARMLCLVTVLCSFTLPAVAQNAAYWVSQLQEKNKSKRAAVIKGLEALEGRGVEGLEAALKHKAVDVRQGAAQALGRLGRLADPAMKTIVKALAKDKDKEVRAHAARAIGQIRLHPRAVIPHLTKALRDKHPPTRAAAAWSLGRFEHFSAGSVAELIRLTKDKKKEVRLNVVGALGRIRAEPKGVLPILAKSLKDKETEVRIATLKAFGHYGILAKEAVPLLAMSIKDRSPEVRIEAVAVLGLFASEAAVVVQALIKALEDSDPRVRTQAAVVIGDLGPRAEAALPALSKALKDKNDDVRLAAATSFERQREVAMRARVELTQALKDSNEAVRAMAAGAISHFGAYARGSVEPLIKNLSDPKIPVVTATVLALAAICAKLDSNALEKDAVFSTIVPSLARLRSHEDTGVQSIVKQSLQRIAQANSK